jgi:hypothetical protein
MQKHFRNPATWGDFEPGECTVCPTRKTRFRSFIPVVFALLLGFMLIGCGGSDGDDVFPLPDFENGVFPLPGEENGEQPGNGDEIVTVTGSGSGLVPFTVGTSGAVTFELTHSGEGNFIVWLRDSDAEQLALLTNKIGDVSDTRVESLEQGDYSLDIDSTGAWSVSIAGAVSNGEEIGDADGVATLITDVRVLVSSVEAFEGGTKVLPALDVCLGGATALAIELDRKPLKAVDIELRTLDFDAAFEVPTSVRVPANEAIKVFVIRAKVDAIVGAKAELSMVPGDRYQVGDVSSVTLTIADTGLPTITIEGPGDAIISQGAVESYLLQRSDAPQTAISVPLVIEGDADAFSVTPNDVAIARGENDGVFQIEAIQSKGGATISFLPPLGYCLGDTTSVDVTIE